MTTLVDPDASGRFGDFGGRYVPEVLVPACAQLEAAFKDAWSDAPFKEELHRILSDFGDGPPR